MTNANYKKALFTLANFLVGKGISRKDAFRKAAKTLKAAEEKPCILTFQKKSGEVSKRVVFSGLGYTPTGSGRPAPEGLRFFRDLTKIILGDRAIISAYQDKILDII